MEFIWSINQRTDNWELQTINDNGVTIRFTAAPFDKPPVLVYSNEITKCYNQQLVKSGMLANIGTTYINNYANKIIKLIEGTEYNSKYKDYLRNQALCKNPHVKTYIN